MKVRAIERGFDNLVLREPGDEFDMPAGSKAPWFETIESRKDSGKNRKGQDTEDTEGAASGNDLV